MSPEQQLDPSRPERRAFYTLPGPQAERVVKSVLERLTRLEDELRVVEGFLSHGAGFAAFLRLKDTAPDDPTLIWRYEQCYADAWDSLDDLAMDTIEALGWREDLAELKQRSGIDDDYLTWNYAALYGRLHEMYDFIELDALPTPSTYDSMHSSTFPQVSDDNSTSPNISTSRAKRALIRRPRPPRMRWQKGGKHDTTIYD
jgi:hypothetical protein